MKNIRIGETLSGTFALPPDIQTVTSAVLGIRGSGKTNTGTVCVEGLLEREAQVVIIDPTDAWWGLQSSGDGKKAGHDIIIAGGAHGHVPLDESNGAALANFVVNHRVSMVLSLRHLRKAAQRRFVTAFSEELYHRKGDAKHRDSILLVIDECDAFIPQKVGGGEARMVGAIEDLVRRGRSSGIGVMLISQRAASVNKDVLTQIEMLVAHRHTSPQDRKALDEWIKLNDTEGVRDEFLESLAKLGMGEAWFWSPGLLEVFARVQVDKRKTFDSSATPKPGESITPPTKVAEINLDALRESLAETIREAEENDPKKLKAEIAKLQKELSGRKPEVDQAAIDAAVEEAMKKHRIESARKDERIEAIAEQLRDIAASLEAMTVSDEPRETTPAPKTAPAPRAVPRAQRAAAVTTRVTTGKATLEQRILDAIAWWNSGGIEAPTREQVGFVAKVKPRGGYFSRVVGTLNTTGLIHYPIPGCLSLTDDGLSRTGEVEPFSRDEMIQRTREVIGSPDKLESRIFDALVNHGTLSRDQLGDRLSVEVGGGYCARVIGSMRTAGLIDYPQPGYVGLAAAFDI